MNQIIPQTDTVFQQPWWLDATAPGAWDAVEIEENGRVVARLPFVFKKRLGLRVLGQPQLTQSLGPWIERPLGETPAKRLSREKDLYAKLIAKLPRFDVFQQNFAPDVSNWLPFYWEGFSQTTRYSYVLDGIRDEDRTYAGISKSGRQTIRHAQKSIEVQVSEDVETVLDLAAKTFGRQNSSLPYDPDLLRRIDDAARRFAFRRAVIGRDREGNVHSAAYVVGDQRRAYLLVSGIDPEHRRAGSGNLVHWQAIREAASFTDTFDFEGSMMEPIEDFYRKFGPRQSPYSSVSKRPRLLTAALATASALDPRRRG